MTIKTDFFDMNAAPMRIGTVRLKVRDLGRVSAFYQEILGLRPAESGEGRILLGTGASPLIEIEGDAALTPRDPRQAGLFHTAFLLPTRADLGRWLAYATRARVPLQGASDHIVSEAVYLADPEGNGVEIYADRPVSRWRGPTGEIRMTTDPLDIQDLLNAAEGTSWSSFPEGGSIGHVHLQVGDTRAADGFYLDILGFDIATRYPGASFFGSGGYHHQLAGNIWNSRGAGPRPGNMAGLGAVEIVVRDDAAPDALARRAEAAGLPVDRTAGAVTLHDPWGTRISLTH